MQDTQIIGNKKRTSESLQKIPSTKNEYRIQCKKEMDLGQQEKVYEWLKQRVNRYGKAVAENEKD